MYPVNCNNSHFSDEWYDTECGIYKQGHGKSFLERCSWFSHYGVSERTISLTYISDHHLKVQNFEDTYEDVF